MTLNEQFLVGLNLAFGLSLLFSLISGFKRGFWKSLLGLLSSVIALVLAFWLAGPLAQVFPFSLLDKGTIFSIFSFVVDQLFSKLVWFVLVWLCVKLILVILAKMMTSMASWFGLSFINKVLGAGVAFLGWALSWMVITSILLSHFFINGKDLVDRSMLRIFHEGRVVEWFQGKMTQEDVLKQLSGQVENQNLSPSDLTKALEQLGLGQDQIIRFLEGIKHDFDSRRP